MIDEFRLGCRQRDEILRALEAIQRQLQRLQGKPDTTALFVLGTNVTIIQSNVTNLPPVVDRN
jgi:hypothetical protein